MLATKRIFVADIKKKSYKNTYPQQNCKSNKNMENVNKLSTLFYHSISIFIATITFHFTDDTIYDSKLACIQALYTW